MLQLLNKFKNVRNVENECGWFLTNTPSEGPLAYLNVVLKPASPHVRTFAIAELHIPDPLEEFYTSYNGCMLFRGLLAIYGTLPTSGYLINRSSSLGQLSYDLYQANAELRTATIDLLMFARYNGDERTHVLIERDSGQVLAYSGGARRDSLRATWPTFDEWLASEIHRLLAFFNEVGNCSADLATLVPGAGKSSPVN